MKQRFVEITNKQIKIYDAETSFKELVIELQEKGIDPCGENGEFHTLVIYCPLFKSKINVPEFRKVTYENYCFLVWEE